MQIMESPTRLNLDQIILATDFTPAADKALAYARALAKHFSSTLTVSHVIDLSVATRSQAALVGFPLEEMRTSGAEKLQRAVQEMREERFDVKGKMAEAFTPGAALVELSEAMDADLIVVGANARHGLSKWILGSFSESIIRHAKCPVMTVGPNARLPHGDRFAPQSILFATDLESDTAVKAATALAFAEESLATIHLAHFVEVAEQGLGTIALLKAETEKALRTCIPNSAFAWCNPKCLVDFGRPTDCILHWARECHADLIVLGARRSSTWFTPWCEGLVEHIIAKAEAPVLTLCTR